MKRKVEIQKTGQQMYRHHELYFTHNLVLSASSSIQVPIAVAATLILFKCSTWSFIMATRARQTTLVVEMVPAFPFIEDLTRGIKSWKIKLFPKPVEGLQRHLPLTIFFMQSFCSSRRLSSWGKSSLACCSSQIWTSRHSLKGVWSPTYSTSHLHQ